MNTKKILNLLAKNEFQDPSTGNLFFPVYIYTYNPSKEQECKNSINQIIDYLSRPTNHLKTLNIDVWQYIMTYFKEKTFGKFTIEELILKKESEGEDVTAWIRRQIFKQKQGASDSGGFFDWLGLKISSYYAQGDKELKPYIIVNGFTESYPYMRPGEFLKNMEGHAADYKMLLFYPGRVEGESFYLFNILESENIYRANILNNLIEDEN